MRIALWSLASASLAAALTTAFVQPPAGPGDPSDRSPGSILASYVEDFRADGAAATARTFCVRVDGQGGGTWTVEVAGVRSEEEGWAVDLREGASSAASFVYTVDAATLEAIDAGRLNALTAQGKAFPGDASPMAIEWTPGVEPFDVNAFSFHFWTRGFPEKVAFAQDATRVVHGVDVVALYYQPGLRTIWSSIGAGQRANNGPGEPIVVPFPAMIIAISGCAKGLVAGEPVEARAGEVVFIPPMTPYEWWNEGDEPAEAILLFFGEGA